MRTLLATAQRDVAEKVKGAVRTGAVLARALFLKKGPGSRKEPHGGRCHSRDSLCLKVELDAEGVAGVDDHLLGLFLSRQASLRESGIPQQRECALVLARCAAPHANSC